MAVSDQMVGLLESTGEAKDGPDLQAIYALIGAGQLLLALWARRRPTYGGIGIRTDTDLERIEDAIDWLLGQLDQPTTQTERNSQ